MILYGRNPVHEALRGRRAKQVREVWATVHAAGEPWLAHVEPRLVGTDEIERRCGSTSHQGVCADAGAYPYASADRLLAATQPLIVALDQIQDPQNLGSICRTAECVGAAGVVIAERRAAEVTPAVCKASAGAVEHLSVARVRNVADFLAQARRADCDFLAQARRVDCWCYGASAADGRDGTSPADAPGKGRRAQRTAPATVGYDAPQYADSGVVLVLGSEGSGLRPRVAKACDQLISLPQHGRVDSLGVSAAAAAILYEILQQREGSLDNSP